MTTQYPLVLTKQYQESIPKWLHAIKLGESLSVIFFPKTDRLRRAQQMVDDKDILQKNLDKNIKYNFQFVDFSSINIEDQFDIEEFLTRQFIMSRVVPSNDNFYDCISYFKKHKIRVILILYEAEKYLSVASNHVLKLLSYIIAKYSQYLSLINLFEKDITHPSLTHLLPSSTNIYDNLFHYPLYLREETLVFVRYLLNKWNIKIDKDTEEKIVQRFGGHFWLVKEAVREIINTGRFSEENEGLQFRLNSICTSLLPSEQSVLEKIATKRKNFDNDEKRSLFYLKNMKVLGKDNQCLIPVLDDHILKMNQLNCDLELHGNHIFLNKVPIEKMFSRKEFRAFKLLLINRNNLVSREQVGKVIWSDDTQSNYSDWALDQILSRLRKRLLNLSLSPELIQAVRGKGYRLKL